MEIITNRFTCQRLNDGKWTVVDQTLQVLASLGGMALHGLPEGRARSGCDVLNRIYKKGLEARDRTDGNRVEPFAEASQGSAA